MGIMNRGPDSPSRGTAACRLFLGGGGGHFGSSICDFFIWIDRKFDADLDPCLQISPASELEEPEGEEVSKNRGLIAGQFLG